MDKQYSRAYFNTKAESWDVTPRSNAPHQLQTLIERLDINQGALVLDVGSGTGVFVPYIQRKVGEDGRVICVDFALNMLTIARVKMNHNSITHVCAEIETAGFNAGVFDAAVCYSTFPHFHDKPLALGNIYNLLQPGGKIFICHSASREFINDIHLKIVDFQDHLIPQSDEMFSLMQVAGFRNILIEESADAYLVVGQK
jgi:ubiquinone/menaquinone biosynthesis C-methylase UbiE